MKCKKCDSPINEGELFCRTCGYKGKLEEQKIKLKQLKMKHRGIVLDKVHSPLFLVVSIFFSAMTLAKLVPIVYNDFSGFFESVFMIIATIGLWTSFASKENDRLARSLRLSSIYDAFIRVILTICIVVGATIIAFAVIGIFAVAGVASVDPDFGGGIFSARELFTIGVAIFVVGALALIMVALFRQIYVSRRAYFIRLARFIETGEYSAAPVPVFGSYALGVAYIFFGVGAIVLSANLVVATSYILNFIFSTFSGLGDLIGMDLAGGEMLTLSDILEIGNTLFGGSGFLSSIFSLFADYINALIGGISALFAIGGFSAVISGVYFIISAVFMTSTHNALDRMRREIDRENVYRLELDRNTKQAINDFDVSQARQKAEQIVEGFVVQDESDGGDHYASEDKRAENTEPTVNEAPAALPEPTVEEAPADEPIEE